MTAAFTLDTSSPSAPLRRMQLTPVSAIVDAAFNTSCSRNTEQSSTILSALERETLASFLHSFLRYAKLPSFMKKVGAHTSVSSTPSLIALLTASAFTSVVSPPSGQETAAISDAWGSLPRKATHALTTDGRTTIAPSFNEFAVRHSSLRLILSTLGERQSHSSFATLAAASSSLFILLNSLNCSSSLMLIFCFSATKSSIILP